nr:hypothetical protein [uncultured Acetatifactor sp.]
MTIKRIDTYQDNRFSQNVLYQHGCFLADEVPYEVEIISHSEAVIRGADPENYPAIIEDFRFYTPHITRFYDENRCIVKEFTARQILTLQLNQIQPSQFYVDEDKIAAISSFIQEPDDIIIQVLPHQDRYISLDGHTRLYYAAMKGWQSVRAVTETADNWVYSFVEEARKRNVHTPKDLMLVSHKEYVEKWYRFCDDFFARAKDK